MPNTIRTAAARLAASLYAPEPDGSYLTYGLIGVAVGALAVVFIGAFYGLDIFAQPLLLVLLAVLAFGSGLLVRKRMKRRNKRAFEREYARTDRKGRSAPEVPSASDEHSH